MKMLSERGGRQAGVGVMLARGVFRDNRACWGDVTALPGCLTCAGGEAQVTAGAASWTSSVGGLGRELILTHLDTRWFVDLFLHPAPGRHRAAQKLQKMVSEPTALWICHYRTCKNSSCSWKGCVVGRCWLLLQKTPV